MVWYRTDLIQYIPPVVGMLRRLQVKVIKRQLHDFVHVPNKRVQYTVDVAWVEVAVRIEVGRVEVSLEVALPSAFEDHTRTGCVEIKCITCLHCV